MSAGTGDFTLRAILGIKDDASGPAGRIQGHFANLKSEITKAESGLKSFNSHMESLKSGAKFLAVGAAAGMLTKSLIGATLETGQLARNIRTLDVSDAGMNAISEAADRMGQAIGTAKTEFLSGAYDIKSGISTLKDNELGAFTEIVAKTSKATKGSTAQMASYFGTVYNVYSDSYKGMSAIDFGTMVGNMTSYAVKAFKTDGPKMQQAMEAVGATAKAMGMSLHEQIAVLGNLSNTMSGGEAGTRLRAFMDKAGEAASKLGVSFTDAQGHLKPVADILDTIKGKFPDLKNAAAQAQIKKAFGSDEAVSFILNLANKTDVLRTGMKDLQESMRPGGRSFMEEMARTASDSTLSNTQKLSYAWQRLKETFGESIESPFNLIIGGVKDMLFWVIRVVNEYPAIRSIIGYGISIAAVFFSVAGTIKVTSGALGMYRLMTGLATAATSTQAGVTSGALIPSLWASVKAVWAFTAALLANPITWVVVGIVALGAAIYAVVKYWDKIRDAAISAWNWIKNSWGNAPGWVKGIVALVMLPFWPFIALVKTIISNWGTIKPFFSALFNGIKMVVSTVFEGIKNYFLGWVEMIKAIWEPIKGVLSKIGTAVFGDSNKNAEQAGRNFGRAWASGVRQSSNVVKGAVTDTMGGVKPLLNRSDAKEGPLSDISSRGRAFVRTWAGGVEDESRSNQVVRKFVDIQAKPIKATSPVIQGMAAANNRTISINPRQLINLTLNGASKPMSIDEFARMLSQVLFRELNSLEAHGG